jgi:uncharacterized iron-regulated membrane protein
MEEEKYFRHQAVILRKIRQVHKIAGIVLFVFFMFISVSGLLLGWKKNSGGHLLPETATGTTTNLQHWLPMHQLETRARTFLNDSVSSSLSDKIDRIDVRKNDGIVKFTFENHYYGIQMDGATGSVLLVEKRWSDLLENIHDGSILDKLMGFEGETFKLIYTSIMSLALLLFAVTGFWLWYGTNRLRKKVKRIKSAQKAFVYQDVSEYSEAHKN